ncbi:hypothetical protein PoB_007492500 [Plakobranchus ocellatus]|uniref:Uncharacterized protein n=1 Tax=Plakobranchus ocellatus TaxID=259542 RepID=A0AAV4DWJ0_9GAST|nr:hypothetical protein PoB_007492500 [Plakobranchus ocellatus]
MARKGKLGGDVPSKWPVKMYQELVKRSGRWWDSTTEDTKRGCEVHVAIQELDTAICKTKRLPDRPGAKALVFTSRGETYAEELPAWKPRAKAY